LHFFPEPPRPVPGTNVEIIDFAAILLPRHGAYVFDIPTHLNHLQDEGQAWIVSTYRAGNVNL
jgi:hypothetical protein